MPGARRSEAAAIHWVREPPAGKLTGSLFIDGSAMHARWPGCTRAGWAIVQLDAQGQMVAAACGPVPVDEAAQQQASDGEDYAAYMLTTLAEPPFEVYVDCTGTLGCLRAPAVYSCSVFHERAHLWTRFWLTFRPGDFQCFKTKARASLLDVQRGLTT